MIYQVTCVLPGSQSGSNVTTAPTDSQTPAQTQSKSGPTVLPTEVTADGGVTGVTPGWGKYLADMFPLLKRTELQVLILLFNPYYLFYN